MQTITVRTSDLPEHIARFVGGKSVEVRLTESAYIGSQQWSEGSRDQYHVASLDVATDPKPVHDPRPWPQNMGELGRTEIAPRCVIIRTGTFCGKPATPYIYARPEDVSAKLAAPAPTLSNTLAQVLYCVACLNSGGKKRFREDRRMSQTAWDSAIAELQALGLVDNRKSATVEGRNAAKSLDSLIVNPYSKTFFEA